MAIRNLTNWNDPVFRKKSKVVEKFDERLWILLDDMRETLEKVGGYGCAAVHVGILRRVVVVNDKEPGEQGRRVLKSLHGSSNDFSDGFAERNFRESGVIELINPKIIEESEETQEVFEGSIAPGAPRGNVTRPKSVTVSAFDRRGNPITISGSYFLAATFCHEIDHLDGIMFIDKWSK